jgi:hypothetical protein
MESPAAFCTQNSIAVCLYQPWQRLSRMSYFLGRRNADYIGFAARSASWTSASPSATARMLATVHEILGTPSPSPSSRGGTGPLALTPCRFRPILGRPEEWRRWRPCTSAETHRRQKPSRIEETVDDLRRLLEYVDRLGERGPPPRLPGSNHRCCSARRGLRSGGRSAPKVRQGCRATEERQAGRVSRSSNPIPLRITSPRPNRLRRTIPANTLPSHRFPRADVGKRVTCGHDPPQATDPPLI